MAVLDDLSTAARAAAERIGPSLVSIGRHGRGTGVVLAAGQVVTNAHNLRDRTTLVTFADGRGAQGTLIGVDVDTDLAVVGVETSDVAPATFADAGPGAGAVVFAASAPRGVRLTFGIVSGTERSFRGPRGRRVTGGFEHTAPLPRGASGGPVLDAEGRVLGINTHRLGDGFYLALPAGQDLQARLARLAAGETIERRTLGIAVAPPHAAARLRRAVGLPERDGLLVRDVAAGSPAEAAGLRRGDLIVAAGGTAVANTDDLAAVLDALEGDSVTLSIVRGVEESTIEVHFTTGDEPAAG
jgi:S1-C subfamily serine protease